MAEFLISWDTKGIEAIVPIGKMREENVVAKLSGGEPKHNIGSIYNMLTIRARFNPQRSPQIWGINVDDEIDENTLRNIADTTPQVLVDLVKEKGVMFYGDKLQESVISY
jgi:phage gp37-like protein